MVVSLELKTCLAVSSEEVGHLEGCSGALGVEVFDKEGEAQDEGKILYTG